MDISVNRKTSKSIIEFLKEENALESFPTERWNQLEKEYGDAVYSELLYCLTQMEFEADAAKDHWLRILNHRKKLESIIKRDVGLRVALADYFINLHPSVENPIIVEISLFLKTEEEALRDELTGLYNRRFFNKILQQELERGRRFQEPLSVILLDIDHFKLFNDNYGHIAGDRALKESADILLKSSRAIDHVTRYGGEEFAIILPRADQYDVKIAAERHRLAFEKHHFFNRSDRFLTISAGCATYPTDAIDGLELIDKADHALYLAKKSGRNGVKAFASDKRRYKRFPIELSIVFRDPKDGGFYPGQTKNISLGGLMLEIQKTIQHGEQLEFRILTKTDDPDVTVSGRCVRIEQDPQKVNYYKIGVMFDTATFHDASIKQLILETSNQSTA